MRTIEEFTEDICKKVQEICDQCGMDAQVTLTATQRRDNVTKPGLIIQEKRSNLSPVIYLNGLYEYSLAGGTDEEIANGIVDLYNSKYDVADQGLEVLKRLMKKPKTAKDHVIFRLYGKENTEQTFADIAHLDWLDFRIVFCLYVGRTADGEVMSSPISRELADAWGITEAELMEAAKQNMERLLPHKIENLRDHMINMILKEMDDPELTREALEAQLPDGPDTDTYILSNETDTAGAGVILYPGLLKGLSDTLESDLLLMPSSIHECLAMSVDFDWMTEEDKEYFRNMVRSVNGTEVDEIDRLSDSIYGYFREEDTIRLL